MITVSVFLSQMPKGYNALKCPCFPKAIIFTSTITLLLLPLLPPLLPTVSMRFCFWGSLQQAIHMSHVYETGYTYYFVTSQIKEISVKQKQLNNFFDLDLWIWILGHTLGNTFEIHSQDQQLLFFQRNMALVRHNKREQNKLSVSGYEHGEET